MKKCEEAMSYNSIKVVAENEHYVARYTSGNFICSGDTECEVKQTLDDLEEAGVLCSYTSEFTM